MSDRNEPNTRRAIAPNVHRALIELERAKARFDRLAAEQALARGEVAGALVHERIAMCREAEADLQERSIHV